MQCGVMELHITAFDRKKKCKDDGEAQNSNYPAKVFQK